MNYIRLINRFYALNSSETIPPAATSLYFFLLQRCNQLGWPESFTLPQAAVILGTGLSESRIRVVRKLLAERGLIEVTPGHRKSQPATYRIVDLPAEAANQPQRPAAAEAANQPQRPAAAEAANQPQRPADSPQASVQQAPTDYPLDDYFAPEQAQLRQTFIMELHRQNPQTCDDSHLRALAREAVDGFRRLHQTHTSYHDFISHLESTIRIINRKSAPRHERTSTTRRDPEAEYQQRQQQLRDRVAQRLANCGVYLDLQGSAPVIGDF